jgi:hypothetical protein
MVCGTITEIFVRIADAGNQRNRKKIVIKLVYYYGPALSGKTTNLMQLHDILNPSRCGEFMTLDTKGDRTLFFDLLPMVATSTSGYSIKLKLFTVPGRWNMNESL